MSSWSFVQHAHTRHSFDSMSEPRALVKHAAALGIDVLAVTDHDTWEGSVVCRAAAEAAGLDLHVILAAEYATDQGDIIGLFLEREIRTGSALEICDQIHEQGGLALLPHPYRWHRLDDLLLDRIDLIEVHNSRTSRADNTRAAELAFARKLPELVGPDAHRLGELGLARNVFEGERPRDAAGLADALLHAPRRFETRPGSMWDEWLSQAVKVARRPSVSGAWWLLRGGVRRMVKPREYQLG